MIRTITPIFSIIIALVIFFFYVKPEFVDIKAKQGEAEQYEEAAKTASALNGELAALLAKKESYGVGDLERLDALVPTTINEVKILTDLSEIARSHNMLFGDIKVTNGDPGVGTLAPEATQEGVAEQKVVYTDFRTSEIAFSLIGTYEQFKAFLADVEKSLVLLEATNIVFDAGEGNLQQYGVSLRAFSLPPIE